jgi:hypothetical protein
MTAGDATADISHRKWIPLTPPLGPLILFRVYDQLSTSTQSQSSIHPQHNPRRTESMAVTSMTADLRTSFRGFT